MGAALRRVAPPVSTPENEDRVVSRRVDNPTEATQEDEAVYRAAPPDAEPESDTDSGGAGGAAVRASRDSGGPGEDDEPTRSE